jgi:type IV secretory pathway TrbF-like protein
MFGRIFGLGGRESYREMSWSAAQVWDERIGSARAQAHNWRFLDLGKTKN